MRRWIVGLLIGFIVIVVEAKEMKIEINIGKSGQKITATLADNPAAQALYQQLPLKISLRAYAGAERITPSLAKALPTSQSPAGYAGKRGDLTYYAPWGNLAIFVENSHVGYATGLVYLGKVDQDVSILSPITEETEVVIGKVD